LGKHNAWTRETPGLASLAGAFRHAKGFEKRLSVRLPTVGHHEQRRVCGTRLHPVGELLEKSSVALLAHLGSKPKTGFGTHRHRKPDDYPLLQPDAHLVGLHGRGGVGRLHNGLVNGLAMRSRSSLPIGDGAFVQTERRDDCRKRTTERKQRDDKHHHLRIALETEEGRSRSCRKRFAAGAAFPSVSKTVVNAQVSCADLAS